jgi:hypothetical protein
MREELMINVTALADGTRRGLGLRAVEGLAPDASHLNQLAAIAYLGIRKWLVKTLQGQNRLSSSL